MLCDLAPVTSAKRLWPREANLEATEERAHSCLESRGADRSLPQALALGVGVLSRQKARESGASSGRSESALRCREDSPTALPRLSGPQQGLRSQRGPVPGLRGTPDSSASGGVFTFSPGGRSPCCSAGALQLCPIACDTSEHKVASRAAQRAQLRVPRPSAREPVSTRGPGLHCPRGSSAPAARDPGGKVSCTVSSCRTSR